jgi:ParB family chromosome partitioning protein
MTEQAKKRTRRLGKGLNSLLTKPVDVAPPVTSDAGPVVGRSDQDGELRASAVVGNEDTVGVSEGLIYVPVDRVVPNPRQPRQVFDDEALSALASSIKAAGLMQPIMVRNSPQTDQYEIIAGERRWRAAQLAGLVQLPAILKELDDKTSAEWALIENLQREDLNPIDKAEAFDRLVVDFDATQKEIAVQLGIDRSSVANFLRLNDLEAFAKDAVRDGRLSMGHAKVLLGIPDVTSCKAIARRCAAEQWSVRELERQLKKRSKKKNENSIEPTPGEMLMENLSEQLGEHLGTQVSVSLGKKKGSGKMTISFYSNEQFEGILETFNFKPKS